MEKVNLFYLQVMAILKELQTKRIHNELLRPVEISVYQKRSLTWKQRKLLKKKEKQRKQIENGYYKGISDSITKINQAYKAMVKCERKE